MFNVETIESIIEEVCNQINKSYGGYHAIEGGQVDGENCPKITFHVGSQKQDMIQPSNGEIFQGTGVVYSALLGSNRCVVFDDNDQEIASIDSIKKERLM